MDQLKSNPLFLQIGNIITYSIVLLVNFLSNALPLNGRTAGEVSDALPSYFTPAGYTFAIWGAIYLALLGFILYQALPSRRGEPFIRQVGWLFIGSNIANITWLFAWHYGYYALSILTMSFLLFSLITIYLRLRIGYRYPALTLADRLLIHLPFSLYLGWISVAMIANVASVAAYWGWDGFGITGPTWSATMMLVAVAIAGLLLFNRRNLAYAAILIWALFGIRTAYREVAIIANTAIVSALLIAALAIAGYLRTGNGADSYGDHKIRQISSKQSLSRPGRLQA